MSSKKLSKSVLDKIKEEEIVPRPEWHFVAKNGMFWVLFGVTAFLGARAVGVLWFLFFELDIPFLWRGPDHGVRLLFDLFPAFWVIFVLLFLIAAMTGLHQTKHGYRWSLKRLVVVNVVVSLVLGTLLYAVGDARQFESSMTRRAPFYKGVDSHKEMLWHGPEGGRLAGMIRVVSSNEEFVLVDRDGREWVVDYDEAELKPEVVLGEGERVRMMGVERPEFHFDAEMVGPWAGPRPFEGPADRPPPRKEGPPKGPGFR
jgi:hypothetical protein